MAKEVMIEAEGLTKFYGSTLALQDVTFQAYKREILGLLGPNGAGKTTAMRILTTFILPTDGTARVGGHSIQDAPLEVRRLIGYLPETAPLYMEMTVRDYLVFVGESRGLGSAKLRERLDWVVDACNLARVFRRPNGQLSRGYKQRVGLAQALIHDPPVLILDEPTSGLDPLQTIGIRELIRQLAREKTVIFSTHILQEVESVSDRILIVNRGRLIADGAIRELQERAMGTNRLTFEVKAEPEEVRRAVSGVRGVVDQQIAPGADGWVRVGVRHRFGQVVDQDLDSIIKEKRWPLREFREDTISLEETFTELVRATEGRQARGKETDQKEAA